MRVLSIVGVALCAIGFLVGAGMSAYEKHTMCETSYGHPCVQHPHLGQGVIVMIFFAVLACLVALVSAIGGVVGAAHLQSATGDSNLP